MITYTPITEEQLITGITRTILIPSGMNLIIETCLNKEDIQLSTKRGKPHTRNFLTYERLLILSSFISRTLSRELKTTHQYSMTSNDISEQTPSTPANHQDHQYSITPNDIIGVNQQSPTNLPTHQYSMTSNDNGITFNGVSSPISMATFSKVLMLSKPKEVQWYVDFLIKYDLIKVVKDEVSFIDWDKRALEGGYVSKSARHFDFSTQFNRRLIQHELTSEKIIEQLKAKRRERLIENFKNPRFTKLLHDLPRRYSFPALESVEEVAKKMVERGEKNSKGKLYVWEYAESDFELVKRTFITKKGKSTFTTKIKTNDAVVCIQEGIAIYARFLHEGLYFKDAGLHTRYYTSLSLIPSWIRKLILIDNQPVVENDFCALHNRLINRLSGGVCPELTGDSHTKLMITLGLESRQEAKQIGLSYWNSRIMCGKTVASKANTKAFERMDDFLQSKYPEIWGMLLITKAVTHTEMSKILIAQERALLEEVIERFVGDEPFIQCYDCVYTTKSIKKEMEALLP